MARQNVQYPSTSDPWTLSSRSTTASTLASGRSSAVSRAHSGPGSNKVRLKRRRNLVPPQSSGDSTTLSDSRPPTSASATSGLGSQQSFGSCLQSEDLLLSTTASSIRRSNSRPATRALATTARSRARPLTSGSYLTSHVTSEPLIICGITESRGVSPTVGLACINVSTMQASLCQILDSQMYVRTLQKLLTWRPSIILYPSTIAESKMMMFLSAETPPGVDLRSIDKRYFTESDGKDHLQQMALEDELGPLEIAIEGKFYALCSFSGVLEYLTRDSEYVFAPHCLRITFEPSDGSMMIDLSTIHSLELIQNLHDARSKDSLFGLLNETLTPMGSRLLRSWILQPSTQTEVLRRRYDALEELTNHENIFVAVRRALKSFVDVDSVLTNIVILPSPQKLGIWQEQCINYVLVLKDFVQKLRTISDALTHPRIEVLRQIATICAPENYEKIVQLISETINTDTAFSRRPLELRHQRLYAVKSGTLGLLDVARTAHKETVDDVLAHCTELASTSELNLETSFDNRRGYFFKFPAHDLESRTLDTSKFINVFRNKKVIECQTLELLKMNGKLASSHEEIMLMSINTVADLIQNIRTEMGSLFQISDSIALLDVLASLAQVASQNDYVRPLIASTMAIKAARNPIKIKTTRATYIPNDVYAPSNARMQILTGCNMSGKSTYIRMIALLQVMAQVGSFVPAEHAEFCIRKQLFARVSTDDKITSNISTFAAEMREMAFILDHVDQDSMVIVDELGRGTSTADGVAIATAVAEELLRSGASIWFATHFHDLAKILDEQPGIWNLHLSVNFPHQDQMEMLYKIADGPVLQTSYGISLARVTCLPPDLLERALEISSMIKAKKSQAPLHSRTSAQAKKQKLLLGLRDQLLWASESSIAEPQLTTWMQALQHEFVLRMDVLDREETDLGSIGALEYENTSNTQSQTTGGAPQRSQESMSRLVARSRECESEEPSDISMGGLDATKHIIHSPGTPTGLPGHHFEQFPRAVGDGLPSSVWQADDELSDPVEEYSSALSTSMRDGSGIHGLHRSSYFSLDNERLFTSTRSNNTRITVEQSRLIHAEHSSTST